MKQLTAGIVLILVVALGAFLYRNILEKPHMAGPEVACTMEAKICPDGSSVGRAGPSCEFAACPEAKTTIATAGIAFTLPSGYVKGVQAPGADGFVEGMLDFYQKDTTSGAFHYITLYSYPIGAGNTADQVIIENTRYQPSDMAATDFSRFTTKVINGKTFRATVIERFEGQVISSYFLARENDVLRFDVLEQNVDWTNPELVIDSLPEHQALVQMLATLETR